MISKTPDFAARLQQLRARMGRDKLSAFLVPRADPWQGEFIADHFNRLEWLTGFNGSAGTAVVLKDRAAIFSDPRYLLRLKMEMDPALYDIVDVTQISIPQWLKKHISGEDVVAFDPWLHTAKGIASFLENGLNIHALDKNLIDDLWENRPGYPLYPAEIFPMRYAGKSTEAKLAPIVQYLKEKGLFAAIVTQLDSIAWFLNVRGCDTAEIPVVLSYLVIGEDGSVVWLVKPEKVKQDVRKSLPACVRIVSIDLIDQEMANLSGAALRADLPVMLDSRCCPIWFRQTLDAAGVQVFEAKDPCTHPKSIKTPEEQAAMRAAHVRDGMALVRLFKWLEENKRVHDLRELDVQSRADAFRKEFPEYRGDSFPVIFGYAENGAVIHYVSSERTNRNLEGGSLLLVDSGAQYIDGTTDVTRTVAVGNPDSEMRERFTLVLKGHIAVANARFPYGTTGAQIDALARAPLWAQGLDYAHGTGHGVGCYLWVHEESVSISKRGNEPIEPGMIISNEPGYYKEGAYGIRIESLILSHVAGTCPDTGKPLLAFETITLCPIDRRLIVPEMLTGAEREWLNAYHVRVRDTLFPGLNGVERDWLTAATAPI
jgi:Xaa-Pro aminopeptidase